MYEFINESVGVTHLIRVMLISVVVYFIVLVAVGVDFVNALRKSRQLGVRFKSGRARNSIRKFNEYIVLCVLATMIDLLIHILQVNALFGVPLVPYVTCLVAISCVAIEVLSVWEKTERKRKKDIAVAIEGIADLARTPLEAQAIAEKVHERMQAYIKAEEERSDKPKAEPLTPDYPND